MVDDADLLVLHAPRRLARVALLLRRGSVRSHYVDWSVGRTIKCEEVEGVALLAKDAPNVVLGGGERAS
eukprot:5987822-Prymnesium_polylepis.1